MCLERKQPLVLATEIQVSPLPGECPDPRALESCSLLPSGASGLDLMDFFFLDEEFLPKKEGGEPLSSSAVGKGWQDLEDFCLQHQRDLGWGFPDPGNAG